MQKSYNDLVVKLKEASDVVEAMRVFFPEERENSSGPHVTSVTPGTLITQS